MIDEIVLTSIEVEPLLELLNERILTDNLYRNVIGRESIDLSRLGYALENGTDRDDEALIWRESHEKKIRSLNLSASDVTYAARLDNFIFGEEFHLFIPGCFYMFYDTTKMEHVKYNGKNISDDLFKPKEGYTFKDTIVCIARLEN